MEQAIRDVAEGHAQRICAPGQWKVYRSEGRVIVEVLA